MDTSVIMNSTSSLKTPAIPYLDSGSERSSRNSIATMIIRSALRSFWRYVKRSSEQRALWSVTGFRRLFRAFLTLSWSLFSVLPKSTSPSRVGPLCKATFSSYTHDRVERPRQTTHAYTLRECGSEVSKLV